MLVLTTGILKPLATRSGLSLGIMVQPRIGAVSRRAPSRYFQISPGFLALPEPCSRLNAILDVLKAAGGLQRVCRCYDQVVCHRLHYL